MEEFYVSVCVNICRVFRLIGIFCWLFNLGYVQTAQQLPTMLRPFSRFQTLRNKMQQGVQTDATCNDVTSNNVGSCWPTMLRKFARSLKVKVKAK